MKKLLMPGINEPSSSLGQNETFSIGRTSREAPRFCWNIICYHSKTCMQTHQGLVKEYTVRDLATKRPAGSDGLPIGCRTENLERANVWGFVEENSWFLLTEEQSEMWVSMEDFAPPCPRQFQAFQLSYS